MYTLLLVYSQYFYENEKELGKTPFHNIIEIYIAKKNR